MAPIGSTIPVPSLTKMGATRLEGCIRFSLMRARTSSDDLNLLSRLSDLSFSSSNVIQRPDLPEEGVKCVFIGALDYTCEPTGPGGLGSHRSDARGLLLDEPRHDRPGELCTDPLDGRWAA